MTPNFSRCIVVGASSGVGEALALALAKQVPGVKLALLARRASELERVAEAVRAAGGQATAIAHDVQDTDQTAGTFQKALDALGGGVDLFVYAAGVMEAAEETEFDPGKDLRMLAINLVGAVAWSDLAAAHFLAQRAGTLIGISSIAGVRGRRALPVYGASKAGLTTYYEGLRNRLSRYGVNVVTIKPGFVDTDMLRQSSAKTFWVISAAEAATQILRVAGEGSSAEVFVPARWGLVATALKLIPSAVFRRMNV
jgi:decaprenylphospho-beta-D-erythro-pentofuranosid-2-ulose 2-reductase